MMHLIQLTEGTAEIILEAMKRNVPVEAGDIRRRNDNLECLINGLEILCPSPIKGNIVRADVFLQKETGNLFLSLSDGDVSLIENSGGVLEG